jgi:threonine dehydrogenase-like Zn-dependent dehydrogenase
VSWHAIRLGTERLHQPLSACSVVVLGGGAIGLAAALVARHFGARRIALGEPNALRREAIALREGIDAYDPGVAGPPDSSVDLVIDAVGAAATRAAACAMVRPGGVIVHAGLLPGHDGLDIRKITLQEITLTGTYCYTPTDFRQTVAALATGAFGTLGWVEERPLSDGAAAFAAIDQGSTPAAKIVLLP